MFEGASHLIFENAKQLRKNMTHAEMVLWMHLKQGINALKFRRQQDLTIMGYKVIRFTNEQVIHQVEVVLQTIKQEILNIINSQKLNASSKDGV